MTPPPRPDVLRAALPDATLHAMIEATFGYGWQAKGLNYEKGRDVLVAALSAALAAPDGVRIGTSLNEAKCG